VKTHPQPDAVAGSIGHGHGCGNVQGGNAETANEQKEAKR
jgi:hypothetical protein